MKKNGAVTMVGEVVVPNKDIEKCMVGELSKGQHNRYLKAALVGLDHQAIGAALGIIGKRMTDGIKHNKEEES